MSMISVKERQRDERDKRHVIEATLEKMYNADSIIAREAAFSLLRDKLPGVFIIGQYNQDKKTNC